MPVPTLGELLTPVSADTVFAQELLYAGQLGMPATAWQPVSIGREILYVNAVEISNWSTVMTGGPVAGGFLTYASGDWLTLCASDTWGTDRILASFATGPIGLSNALSTPYVFNPGDVRVLNVNTGQTYTNTTGGTVPAAVGAVPGTLATTQFSADAPGSASNLTSTQTLQLVTTINGVTPYYVQNLIGQDAETDPNLQIRARQANAKASPNGPADAYNYYAKSTVRPDGSSVGVTRTNQVQANGTVTLYLANATGPLTTPDHDLVFANVNGNVVPTGFTVVIPDPSCATLSVNVAFTLTPSPTISSSHSAVEGRINTALTTYFASIPVGGDKASAFQGVYVSTIVQLIRNAGGSDIINVVLTAPTTDQALTVNQVPVLGTFTPTWAS